MVGAGESLFAGRLDLRNALEEMVEFARECLPAFAVDGDGAPGDVRIGDVEAALGGTRGDVGADLLDRGLDRGVLDDRRELAPGGVGDPGPTGGAVVVLDGPASGLALDELQKPERLQAPDVVADDAEGGVELGGQLARARRAVRRPT